MSLRPLHLAFALLIWCLAIAVPAVAADPVARAVLQSKGTLYVGQQVMVDVSVLVPNYFLQPPRFPAIDLSDATVTLQDGQALNLNETIDGTAYSGIQRTYVVVPQRDGKFTLPPAEITFGYAAVPGQVTQGKARLPALVFTVAAAPGGTEGQPGVVAAKVMITQDLSPDPKALKAGDTLVRTITLRAEGLPAMMIPAPEFNAPQGIRVYRQDPVLSEETDARSQPIAGVRKDVAQFLFSDTGQYNLPAVELNWFDPVTAKTETVSAPAVAVSVVAVPVSRNGLAPPVAEAGTSAFNWFLTGAMSTGALGAMLIIWFLAQVLSKLQVAWEQHRSDSRESEAAYFRLVELACQDGSLVEMEKALDIWSRKAGILPLRRWIARFGNEEALVAFDALRQAVYGTTSAKVMPGAKLSSDLRKSRAAWLEEKHRRSTHWHGKMLPPLNPSWNTE